LALHSYECLKSLFANISQYARVKDVL